MMPSSDPASGAHRARHVRDSLPEGGLFADQHWRISPEPLALGEELLGELETLGRVLLQFYRAVNLLYRQSVGGQQPPWVAALLDQGKPSELIDLQRSATFKNDIPRVIRPDCLLTDEGVAITELDSVPGGIGLTGWLNEVYAGLGFPVVGGSAGMVEGFRSIFDGASRVQIVISQESSGYRPEMEWLTTRLGDGWAVRDEHYQGIAAGDAVYRFFELFDVANVPAARGIFSMAREGVLRVTPGPKPLFEEKLLFGLLWNRNLRPFWRRELGEGFLQRLLRLVPYTWVVDPDPLPPHGAIPELNLTDWRQLKTLSQRERNLILKVSGYSERAWGARGVHFGSDLSGADWSAAVEEAIKSFDRSPYVLQRYHKPKSLTVSFFDFSAEKLVVMPGRARLCPYYFVDGTGDSARARLSGVLATVCPADKKIIHGMKDAVIVPCIP